MKTAAVILAVTLIALPAVASDLSLSNLIEECEQIDWSAAYATGPGSGLALSRKVSSIRGYRQYLDGIWTGSKLFGGLSSELPYIQTMLSIDRIGFGVRKEHDLAAGVIFIKVIK